MGGAVRLGALSQLQQIYVMTHDSIFLGEDGPTHQPVEVLPLCRATPNLNTWRPADGKEVVTAWKDGILRRNGPTVICLTRQGVPPLAGTCSTKAKKGAYTIVDCGSPQVILVATGSEVGTCVDAAKLLAGEGIKANVVSCPCVEAFLEQPVKYRRSVLPAGVLTVSVEASSTLGWSKLSHFQIGVDTFGASAPLKDIQKHFGFTGTQVAAKVMSLSSSEAVKAAGVGALPCLM